MENIPIFGSNFELPSLPGLQSDCEKELALLMKEVDLEFKNRYRDLHKELSSLRSLCQAQQKELENAKSILISHQQDNGQIMGENQNMLHTDIERLKEENCSLKRENENLHRKADQAFKSEHDLDNLKRNFQNKEEENSVLKIRLNKLDEKYRALQSNYQKLANFVSLQQPQKVDENKQGKIPSSLDSIDTFVSIETEKFVKKETELHDELYSKMNQKIQDLERRLNEEIS